MKMCIKHLFLLSALVGTRGSLPAEEPGTRQFSQLSQ